MTNEEALLAYVLRLGDNALVLGQRMTEVVTAYPELEEELANANFALDYLGQARMFYTYAGELEGMGRGEDDFAFLRDEHEYRNVLLLELPNGHFGDSITRLVMFETFYLLQLDDLQHCADQRIAEIAARAAKEIRYHVRHNANWLIRLGDGTDESHARVQESINDVWRYTGELFVADAVDSQFEQQYQGPNLEKIRARWQAGIAALLEEATLTMPDNDWMASGGKQGRHTEHLGYMLAEMQYLQRSHPEATW